MPTAARRHSRKYRLATWFIIALTAATFALAVHDCLYHVGGRTVPAPPPDAPLRQRDDQLTEDDLTRLREGVYASEGLAALLPGTEYRVVEGTPWGEYDPRQWLSADGRLIGANLFIQWDEPVDLLVPWHLLHCRGTRVRVIRVRFDNLEALAITYHFGEEEVVGYAVSEFSSHFGYRYRYEAQRYRDAFGSSDSCPPGLGDPRD